MLKNICRSSILAVLFCAISKISMASTTSLTCANEEPSEFYTLQISKDWTAAKLMLNEETLMFGDLVCSRPTVLSPVKLTCYSQNVADAGYNVVLIADEQNSFKAELSEVTIMGSKALADLSCTDVK